MTGVVLFCLPQKQPLEWAVPDSDQRPLRLTVTLESSQAALMVVDLHDTLRWAPQASLHIPVSAARTTFEFPLPLQPLAKLRFIPLETGPAVFVHQMTIRNGDGGLVKLEPFKIERSSARSEELIELAQPLLPADFKTQLRRAVTSSLVRPASLSVLVLLAASFSLAQATGARLSAANLLFVLFVSLLFALVVNRGLLRQSFAYARAAETIHAQTP